MVLKEKTDKLEYTKNFCQKTPLKVQRGNSQSVRKINPKRQKQRQPNRKMGNQSEQTIRKRGYPDD